MDVDTEWRYSHLDTAAGNGSAAPLTPFLSSEAPLRRIFALLLVTPLLANCTESVTPVSPSGRTHTPVHSDVVPESPLGDASAEATLGEGWTQSTADNWTLDEWSAQQPLAEAQAQSASTDAEVQSAPGAAEVMMYFGNPEAGTAYPSGVHDASFHGRDRVIPGAVAVDVGQKITFRVYPGHRVAIYKPGTRPEDITVVPGSNFVLDGTNRLALQAAPVPQLSIAIHKPGTYLVICAVTRHFVSANMYGWIHVR
jgi:plastocyanin